MWYHTVALHEPSTYEWMHVLSGVVDVVGFANNSLIRPAALNSHLSPSKAGT
jgi:hypothetical protein